MAAESATAKHIIGVISDTHGLLRPEAVEALSGVEMILHAGDVHRAGILEELHQIAPVIAVRGNHDKGVWANDLNEVETIEIGNVLICMIHDLKALNIDLSQSGFRVVICGHSHKPINELSDDVLFLNPGSAGPRRFKLPVTVAKLKIAGETVEAEIIEILTQTDDLK